MLKRQSPWSLWHRCRHCGTVFNSKEDLREHLTEHKFNRNLAQTNAPSTEPAEERAPLARSYRGSEQPEFASQA